MFISDLNAELFKQINLQRRNGPPAPRDPMQPVTASC